jgi:hypothetical protein
LQYTRTYSGGNTTTAVNNSNSATLENGISGAVTTGGNTSRGARGEAGGNGGNASPTSDHTVYSQSTVMAGHGAAGGFGGKGGNVSTGSSLANVQSVTIVGQSMTRINRHN